MEYAVALSRSLALPSSARFDLCTYTISWNSSFIFRQTCTFSLSPCFLSLCLSWDGVALNLDSILKTAVSLVISRVNKQRDR